MRASLARKGWTQQKLETEADLAKGYVSRILKGEPPLAFAGTIVIHDAVNPSPAKGRVFALCKD